MAATDAPPFVLYDFPMSGNAYKVRCLLRELGLPFHIRWLDLLAGEQYQPAFRAKNPAGQVPTLELPDGTCLRESVAILLYLAEGTPLLPDDRVARADVTAWLAFEQSAIDGIVSRARFRRRHPEAIPTPESFFNAWLEEGHRGLKVLERHLAARAFVMGDAFTIADIALYAYTHCADEGGYDLERYPAMRAWHARVAGREGWRGIDDNPEACAPEASGRP